MTLETKLVFIHRLFIVTENLSAMVGGDILPTLATSSRPSHEASTKPADVPSQAKRRLEAMTANVDHKLAAVFTVLMSLYALVTFGTWIRLESQEVSSVMTSVALSSQAQETVMMTPVRKTTLRLQEIHDLHTLQHTFPIHVGDDMEVIEHPGMYLADQSAMVKILKRHPELPPHGQMKVPKFWNPLVYGEKGVRHFLGQNGKRLITPEEAKAIGSFDPVTGLETIYISVASYRDPECQLTVEDMFLRAEHPERMRVAVIDQRAENDDVPPCAVPEQPCSEDPSQVLCRFQHLIDRFEVPAFLSVGPVFARHLANRMYRGKPSPHLFKPTESCFC